MTTQKIWELYADNINHFIFGKVKNSTISDDLVQETFLKVHTKLQTLKDPNKLKS